MKLKLITFRTWKRVNPFLILTLRFILFRRIFCLRHQKGFTWLYFNYLFTKVSRHVDNISSMLAEFQCIFYDLLSSPVLTGSLFSMLTKFRWNFGDRHGLYSVNFHQLIKIHTPSANSFILYLLISSFIW